MNGWFPKINSRGDIASGNTEVWITYADGRQVEVATDGGGAQWLTSDELVYNLHEGGTVFWPSRGAPIAGYSLLTANEQGQWAGALAGDGGIVRYVGIEPIERIPLAALPKFHGADFGYVTPYQSQPPAYRRDLIINGQVKATGPIVDFCVSPTPIAVVATGTYTRDFQGAVIVQPTEGAPVFSDGWVCSNAGNAEGLYVRPADSVFGYFLPGGEWYYHDFRKFGDTLLIVASTHRGELRVKRISVSDPRVDLRSVVVAIPTPPPPNPVVIPHPTPTPLPEPAPMPTRANPLADLTEIRYHGDRPYPTPLGARHWEFLVEVAQWFGAKLFRKDGGDHVWVPALNHFVSQDTIGQGDLGNVWVDILGDGEGAAVPTWDAHPNAAGEYLDVSGIVLPGATPVPVPAPTPTPPPAPTPTPTPDDLPARVQALESGLAQLRALLRSA